MSETEVQAPVTPLGGQPIRAISPTHQQIQESTAANEVLCQSLWKELQEKILDIEKRLPSGMDKATNDIASYIHYNKSKIASVIK